MKTTYYVAFCIFNSETRNFLLSVVESDDKQLVDKFANEKYNSLEQLSLRKYIFEHPETYNNIPLFVESLKYFAQECFQVQFLGSYIERSEAEHRIQISLDSFAGRTTKSLYYNDCFNLNPAIESEIAAQKSMSSLNSRLIQKQKEMEAEGRNSKSEVKKQSITIVENETGEEHNFETKGDCMRWLKCATDTFARFLKGQTKLNKKYTVKEEDQEE